MKKKTTSLWSGVSVLIVGVLLITAFFRGSLQPWLYGGVFAAWGIWAAVKFLLPYLRELKYRCELRCLKRKQERAACQARERAERQAQEQIELQIEEQPVPDKADQLSLVLQRHVNFRISSYLKSAFPEAAWEWCEEYPESIIAGGGACRVKLFNVPDYNFAEVRFDQQANIKCSMLKMVPLTEVKTASGEPVVPKEASTSPVDPQVWYEVQVRKVMESVVADLASRGYSSLTIKGDGDICIKQADAEVKQSAVENMPDKKYWPGLVQVLEREGLAAKATDTGVVVSW